MRTVRRSLLLIVVGALLVSPAALADTLAEPEVDAAVQVTSDVGAARGHATPALAQDPNDPLTLVIADSDAYTSRCSVHVSRNGGLSWSLATQPTTPADWPGCGFAVTGVIADLEFADDGTLYYAFSAFQPTTYQQRIYLAKSTDLGVTWEVTALPRVGPDPAARQMGMDAMPSLAIDRNNPQNVYVAWWSNNGSWNLPSGLSGSETSVWCRLVDNKFLARPWISGSTDGGRTFSAPVDMAPGVGHCTTEPYITQAKDGSIVAFFGEATRTLDAGKAPPAHLFFSRSTDQGKTWAPKPIYEQDGPADGSSATSTSDWLGATYPGVDVNTGALYVTWENMGIGTPKVMFLRSLDGGTTWGEPVKVNDVDGKRDFDFPEVFPTMDVASNGRIDIAWYDYRNDAGFRDGERRATFQDVYYAYSTDGGETFSKNVRINDRAIDRRFGPKKGSIDGPMGVVSDDTAALIAWDDTRNGNEITTSQDIYFARVRFATPGEAFGGTADTGTSPFVAGLFGAAIALAIGGLILIGFMLANRSKSPPTGPSSTTRPAETPTTAT
ncbi:MAG: hypothetical protein ACRD12_20640 [Acidimicrobiales bacterium]